MKLLTKNLYIVSTPIGNLDDITLRAIEILKKSDIILCEDTRRSIKLLNHFKIKKKLISYHKYNEKKQTRNIIEYFNQGKILALISDAGTPLLSDPGRLLLNCCIEERINIVPIPGVSSITTAMSVSGFKDQFLFYGFLPKTEKELDKTLTSLVSLTYSLVFFIPAVKINFYLKRFKTFFKGRNIMIAKEITKIHEFFFRDEIDNIKLFKNQLKGELTVVISENSLGKKNSLKINESDKTFINSMINKISIKEIINFITKNKKIPKKEIYNYCIKLKNEN